MGDDLKQDILNIKKSLDVESFDNSDCDAISDLQKGVCEVFSATPIGRQIFMAAKSSLKVAMASQATAKRIDGLVSELHGSLAGLTRVPVDKVRALDEDLVEVNKRGVSADAVPGKVLRECFDACIVAVRADIAGIFKKILIPSDGVNVAFENFRVKDGFSVGMEEVNGLASMRHLLLASWAGPQACLHQLQAILRGPWELLKYGTMSVEVDMSAFEDFAVALSELDKFEDSMRHPDTQAECAAFAIAAISIAHARQTGAEHLTKMEEKCLEPKWEIVRPVLYKDEGYWFRPRESEGGGGPWSEEFVNERSVEDLSLQHVELNNRLPDVSGSISRIAALAVALQKPNLAAVVQAQWCLFRARLFFVALSKHVVTLRSDSTLMVIGGALFMQMVGCLRELQVVVTSAGLDTKFENYIASAVDAIYMPYDIFKARALKGIDASKGLVDECMGLWTLRMHSKAQSVDNMIPADWKSYVVDVFDPVQATEKLLNKAWNTFVAEWTAMNNLLAEIEACDNSFTGKVREKQKSLCETVERVSTAGKEFVTVVTTCCLILQTLPNAPKAERGTIIQSHFDTVTKTGAALPENLRVYLLAEQKKAAKSGGSKRKAAAAAS